MDDLDDELDLQYHRDLEPDVYYRCPCTEALNGALHNELEKNAASLIPVDIVTEFVFGKTSTITVPVTQQPDLDTLFEPADHPQSITVEHALCYGIEGKERLKLQRAIARSFVDKIQSIDGFKYAEYHAWNKEGKGGARFRYVCRDSLQGRNVRTNWKKKKMNDEDGSNSPSEGNGPSEAIHDCRGAIHVRFSTKREAVNVMYIHNPIHRDVESRPQDHYSQPANNIPSNGNPATDGSKTKKRKKPAKDHHVEADPAFHDPQLDMLTSPEALKAPTKKQRKKDAPETNESAKKTSKSKQTKTTSKARQQDPTGNPSSSSVQPVKGKCLRCREKGIKCNEAKPTCNQCLRGLWTCQYEAPGPKKRSKNGCLNCKNRKRKCTEERPSCSYCLRVDDDCMYGEVNS